MITVNNIRTYYVEGDRLARMLYYLLYDCYITIVRAALIKQELFLKVSGKIDFTSKPTATLK